MSPKTLRRLSYQIINQVTTWTSADKLHHVMTTGHLIRYEAPENCSAYSPCRPAGPQTSLKTLWRWEAGVEFSATFNRLFVRGRPDFAEKSVGEWGVGQCCGKVQNTSYDVWEESLLVHLDTSCASPTITCGHHLSSYWEFEMLFLPKSSAERSVNCSVVGWAACLLLFKTVRLEAATLASTDDKLVRGVESHFTMS